MPHASRLLTHVLNSLCLLPAANLNKVPRGGWFALAIAGGVFCVSFLWWWGTHTKLKGVLASQVLTAPLINRRFRSPVPPTAVVDL